MNDIPSILGQHPESYDSDCGYYHGCGCGWDNGTDEHNDGYQEHVAEQLQPALAAAWDEGHRAALDLFPARPEGNPYRQDQP